jgi:hypothetical protein
MKPPIATKVAITIVRNVTWGILPCPPLFSFPNEPFALGESIEGFAEGTAVVAGLP